MLRKPNSTDETTATTLNQEGWAAEYRDIVLGAGWKDFETEQDAAKEQERSEQELFLSAVKKLTVKRI